MRWTLFCIAMLVLGCSRDAAQTTTTTTSPTKVAQLAASCSYDDIAAKVAGAKDGDTVIIPNGNCTWTTQLDVTVGITLEGQSELGTVITDNVVKDGSANSSLMSFIVDSPKTFKIGNMTVVGQAEDRKIFNRGHISLQGTASGTRIHHITVTNPQTSFLRASGCLYGLIDHVTMTGNGVHINNLANWEHDACFHSSYGDGMWAHPISKGALNAIFIEDNTFIGGIPGVMNQMVDGFMGLNMVVRYNTLIDANSTMHGTDSGNRGRSSRWRENYGNTVICTGANTSAFMEWIRGGSGIVFNNSVTCPAGINNISQIESCRDGASCGLGAQNFIPWSNPCDGTRPYDQNSTASGYRCVDQPGAGTSDDLMGEESPAVGWVHNILEPIYTFNNTIGGLINNCGWNGNTAIPCTDSGNVQLNRDAYYQVGAFDGASGVGVGPRASRPPTCTAGVAWWATDQGGNWNTTNGTKDDGTLDVCDENNIWRNEVYTPYIYPHPLQN